MQHTRNKGDVLVCQMACALLASLSRLVNHRKQATSRQRVRVRLRHRPLPRGKRLGGVEGVGAGGARPVLSSRKLASADGVLRAGLRIDRERE